MHDGLKTLPQRCLSAIDKHAAEANNYRSAVNPGQASPGE